MAKSSVWVPGKAWIIVYNSSFYYYLFLLLVVLAALILSIFLAPMNKVKLNVNVKNNSSQDTVNSTTCEPLPHIQNGYYSDNCTANQSLLIGQSCTFKCRYFYQIENEGYSDSFNKLDFNCSTGGSWVLGMNSCDLDEPTVIFICSLCFMTFIRILLFLVIYTSESNTGLKRKIAIRFAQFLPSNASIWLLNSFIENEQVEQVKKYINRDNNVIEDGFIIAAENVTPLHRAMRHCNNEIVQLLLNHPHIGTCLNEKNSHGDTPFIVLLSATRSDTACPQQIHDIVLSLLNKGCSIKEPDFLLNVAIKNCPTSLCVLLINKGANINGLYEAKSTLHIAIEQESINKVKLLIQHKPKILKYNMLTPLEYAIASESNSEIIEELLAYENPSTGHFLNIIKKIRNYSEKDTPILSEIIRLGINSIVGNFITWGDLVKTDAMGVTALDLATKHRNIFTKIQELFPAAAEYSSKEMSDWYSLKKRWSHKVPITDAQQPIISCETLWHEARRFFDHTPEGTTELKEINKSIKTVLSRVSNYFASREQYKHFQFEVLLAGSLGENTKVFLPDEADLVLVIKPTNHIHIEYDNGRLFDAILKINNHTSAWNEFVNKEREIRSDKFKNGFLRAMEEALHASNSDIICSTGRLYAHSYNCENQHKLPRLKLKWSGTVFKELTISVDAVPAFKMEECIFRDKFALTLHRRQVMRGKNTHSYAIPKTKSTIFPISFSSLETETMLGLPKVVRDGYIFAKAVRLPKICWCKTICDIEIIEPFRTDEFIKSFHLKCCLFSLLRDQTLVVPDGSERRAYIRWTELIYQRLLECIQRGKLYPYYIEDDFYARFYAMLKCPHALHVEYSASRKCCQTRKIMIIMCENIISYLRNDDDYDVSIKCVPRNPVRRWVHSALNHTAEKLSKLRQYFRGNISFAPEPLELLSSNVTIIQEQIA